jgi:LacI family transcriptional regulator
MSLVGCDGILAPMTYPPLTSIATHCGQAGERAVDLLLESLDGKRRSGERLSLATELIIRATTAPPGPGDGAPSRQSPQTARGRRRAARIPLDSIAVRP